VLILPIPARFCSPLRMKRTWYAAWPSTASLFCCSPVAFSLCKHAARPYLKHARAVCILSPQAALRATLYGGKNRIDIARLQRLASGFNRFTVDGLAANSPAAEAQQVAPLARMRHSCC